MQQNVKRKRYKIIYIKYYIDVVVVVVFIFFFLGSISFSLLLILFLPFDFFFLLLSRVVDIVVVVVGRLDGIWAYTKPRCRSKTLKEHNDLSSVCSDSFYSASVAASVCTVVLEPDREMEGKTAVLCASSTFRPVFVFCCYCCCRWPAVRTAIYDTDVNLREMRYDAILLYSYFVGVLVSLQAIMQHANMRMHCVRNSSRPASTTHVCAPDAEGMPMISGL